MVTASTIQYNFGGYLQCVPTLAALRSTTTSSILKKGDTIQVTGSVSSDDHGGGDYVWLPAETAADDGVLFIKPNDVAAGSPGRWVLFGQAKALELEIGLQELDAIVYDPVLGNVALHASYETEIILRASGDSALSERIDTLTATVNDDVASLGAEITNVQSAFASTTEAQAQTIQTLDAKVDTNNSNTEAQIQNEQTARATADSALAQTIQTLTATVNDNNTNTTAEFENEQTARANADGALSQEIISLTATTQNQYSSTTASISNEQTARADADSALAQQINSLTATVNGNTASINDESTVRADADSALATRVSTLEADDSNTGLSARVSTVESAVANLDGKTAAYWSVESVAGNNRAQLTIHADANNGAGVDIVGDVSIDGNLTLDGSLITSKIADGAITGYFQAYNSQSYYGEGTGTIYSMISFNVHMDYAGDILLWATCGQSYTSTSGSRPWHLDIYVDNGDYGGCGGATATTDSAACSGRVSVGAGDHTVELRWFGSNVMTIPTGAASLIAMRAYR